MRTSAPDILAAGDAVETAHLLTGEPVLSMLAGPANREGRIAADTIAGREDVGGYRGTQGTAVVKVFEMTAGGTGLTETELHAAGMDFRKVYTHQNGHAAYYPGTAPLFLKVLFDPAGGKLLGAQVLGWDGVDKRIDVLAVALRAGMTVFDLEHLELATPRRTGRRRTRSTWPASWARTCCAATSPCGTRKTTQAAPGR